MGKYFNPNTNKGYWDFIDWSGVSKPYPEQYAGVASVNGLSAAKADNDLCKAQPTINDGVGAFLGWLGILESATAFSNNVKKIPTEVVQSL